MPIWVFIDIDVDFPSQKIVTDVGMMIMMVVI